MPELPEVETVARQLHPLVTGRGLRGLRVFDSLLRPGRGPRVGGIEVSQVFRLGKQVVFRFRGHGRKLPFLVFHLRMTGRLVWRPGTHHHLGARRHLRARLELQGGAVEFIDPRRFGTSRWITDLEQVLPSGVDPMTLGQESSPPLSRLLAGSRQPLKIWLLRQDKLAGLGNIYASEILHRAGLSPFRMAGFLSRAEVGRLQDATLSVLELAIERCGTTFSDFQDAHGELGSYQECLEVYGREGQVCRRCGGGPIERAMQQQRSTYFCPDCQKKGTRRRG